MGLMDVIGERALAAKVETLFSNTRQKNDALMELAHILRASKNDILAANAADIESGKVKKLSAVMLERIKLDEERIEEMALACENIAALPDPVGEVVSGGVTADGVKAEQVRTPVGVVGVICEATHQVVIEAAALCIKSSNVLVFRGGREAFATNECLTDLVRTALRRADMAEDAVINAGRTDSDFVHDMMTAREYIDILIPKGSPQLVEAVVNGSTVPVLKTGTGSCHIYVDTSADTHLAAEIAENSRLSRPFDDCSVNTVLVHSDVAEVFLRRLMRRVEKSGIVISGCEMTEQILGRGNVTSADDEEYRAGSAGFVLAVKVVDDMAQALEHIRRYSTGLVECIVTESIFAAEEFKNRVDAACICVNAPTVFAHGSSLGLGADIGIMTDKLSSRGAIALAALTTTKCVISSL